jgi:hypothetical protein
MTHLSSEWRTRCKDLLTDGVSDDFQDPEEILAGERPMSPLAGEGVSPAYPDANFAATSVLARLKRKLLPLPASMHHEGSVCGDGRPRTDRQSHEDDGVVTGDTLCCEQSQYCSNNADNMSQSSRAVRVAAPVVPKLRLRFLPSERATAPRSRSLE